MKPDFKIDFENGLKVPAIYGESKRATLKKGDVLIAVKGATIGSEKSVCFVENEIKNTIINGSIFKFQIKNQNSYKYIAYMLSSELTIKQMKYSLVANNAVDYLDKSLIKNLLIPLPPKTIQEKIISIMDKAYSEKQSKEAEAKKLLDSIDEYLLGELGIELPEVEENTLESRMSYVGAGEVLGGRLDVGNLQNIRIKKILNSSKYNVVKIKKFVKNIKTGTTPSTKENPYSENGIPFLRNTNLQKGELDLSDIKYVKENYKNSLTYSNKNEIIICIAGTVGESAINKNDQPLAINQNISSLCIDEKNILLEYLTFYFNTKLNIEFVKSQCSMGTIYYLNNTNLLNLIIPVPPLETQKSIATHISNLRAKAKLLEDEARDGLKLAKVEVEGILLGGEEK